MNKLLKELFEHYESYKETSIKHKRFKHKDIVPLISKLENSKKFEVSLLGHSVENREIFKIKYGTGKIKVLLWSQMHGDEPTATMALFDFFNFLSSDNSFDNWKNELYDKCTLYFIPMLNPDGTERFQRQNALGIDLNRDAVRLANPETALLKKFRDEINAEFGFNLHNQTTRYSVGKTDKQAAFSFLAPKYDESDLINDVRLKTMQLVADIYEDLSEFIPGRMAKYMDDFEPRAFGDNMIKWGTSCILVETGGWHGDYDHDILRKYNFIILASGLNSIISGSYANKTKEDYLEIPDNGPLLYDLILKNINFNYNGRSIKADIAINFEEKNNSNTDGYYFESVIEHIGDLDFSYALETYDMHGLRIKGPSLYENSFENLNDLDETTVKKLLSEGYTHLKVKNCNTADIFTYRGINIFTGDKFSGDITLNSNADFSLWEGNRLKYTFINGFSNELKNISGIRKNSLII